MVFNIKKIMFILALSSFALQAKAKAVMRFVSTIEPTCTINKNVGNDLGNKQIAFFGDRINDNYLHSLSVNTNKSDTMTRLDFVVNAVKKLKQVKDSNNVEKQNLKIKLFRSSSPTTVADRKMIAESSIVENTMSGTIAKHDAEQRLFIGLEAPNINKNTLEAGAYQYAVTVTVDCS